MRGAILDSAVDSAVSATEGAVLSGAKTAATSAVKKSIFGTKTVIELVKEGRSNKTAELIFGLKSISNITVKGGHANQVIRIYIETFSCFYNSDVAELGALRFFNVDRDPTQWAVCRFFWPKTRNISTASPLSEKNENIQTHIESAVYDFFYSMQQNDIDLMNRTACTSNPVTLAALLVPRVVDLISSLESTDLVSQLYQALSDFCKDLDPICEAYYGKYWTKNQYIVDFIRRIPDLIQSFSTESIRAFNIPSIDKYMEVFFKNSTVLSVECCNVLRVFIPSLGLRKDLSMPPTVGVRFDILHSKGPSVTSDSITDCHEVFSKVALDKDKLITEQAKRLIKFATRTDQLVVRFIEYVYAIAQKIPAQERERIKSSKLESMISRLIKQLTYTSKLNEDLLQFYDIERIQKIMRKQPKFNSLARTEKRRVLVDFKKKVLPNLQKLFLKAAKFYRKQLLVENACRALKFFAEDSKAAVMAPQVKEFVDFLSYYYVELKAFSQELKHLSTQPFFRFSGMETNARNLNRYSKQIERKVVEAIRIRNEISGKIAMAEGNTHSRTRPNQFASRTHLSSDAQKILDLALQLLLAFVDEYPQYSIKSLVKIREAIWGKYAWQTLKKDQSARAFAGESYEENELTSMCRAMRVFTHRSTQNKKNKKSLRSRKDFQRRKSYLTDLRDGRMTGKVIKKIQKAKEAYIEFSQSKRGKLHYFTNKHSDLRIEHVESWVEGFVRKAQQAQLDINEKNFLSPDPSEDPRSVINVVYESLIQKIIEEKQTQEAHSFGFYIQAIFFGSGQIHDPFIQFYNQYRSENDDVNLKPVSAYRLQRLDSDMTDDSDIMSEEVEDQILGGYETGDEISNHEYNESSNSNDESDEDVAAESAGSSRPQFQRQRENELDQEQVSSHSPVTPVHQEEKDSDPDGVDDYVRSHATAGSETSNMSASADVHQSTIRHSSGAASKASSRARHQARRRSFRRDLAVGFDLSDQFHAQSKETSPVGNEGIHEVTEEGTPFSQSQLSILSMHQQRQSHSPQVPSSRRRSKRSRHKNRQSSRRHRSKNRYRDHGVDKRQSRSVSKRFTDRSEEKSDFADGSYRQNPALPILLLDKPSELSQRNAMFNEGKSSFPDDRHNHETKRETKQFFDQPIIPVTVKKSSRRTSVGRSRLTSSDRSTQPKRAHRRGQSAVELTSKRSSVGLKRNGADRQLRSVSMAPRSTPPESFEGRVKTSKSKSFFNNPFARKRSTVAESKTLDTIPSLAGEGLDDGFDSDCSVANPDQTQLSLSHSLPVTKSRSSMLL